MDHPAPPPSAEIPVGPSDQGALEDDEKLKKELSTYYLPWQLIKAFMEIGSIPAHSQEAHVGVGFIDIADYTFLSKFLSPKENQILLNGLYTAFRHVLERHGGFLNKIDGDALMFHFDGVINYKVRELPKEEQLGYIVRNLFFTCVEMQRVCVLFNQAHSSFLSHQASEEDRRALEAAFDIMRTLRSKTELTNAMEAFFQIRIRVGANVGEVIIGNFGPEGSKQWDVIGLPVIDAKRMESTAPVGGLRISENFYRQLEAQGVVEEYHNRFRREAEVLGSVYRSITKSELFAFKEVVIQEKKGASYRTYSVQVNPTLPEALTNQVLSLLLYGEMGADRIIKILQYHRGNHYVINAMEKLFGDVGVVVRKEDLLDILQPARMVTITTGAQKQGRDPIKLVREKLSLFRIFTILDKYLDAVKDSTHCPSPGGFLSYAQHMDWCRKAIPEQYTQSRRAILQKGYFFEVVFPMVFESLRASILEHQLKGQENLSEL